MRASLGSQWWTLVLCLCVSARIIRFLPTPVEWDALKNCPLWQETRLVLQTEAWNLRKGPKGKTSCRCGHANRHSRAVGTQRCIPVLPVSEVQLLSWGEPASLTTTAASTQHLSLFEINRSSTSVSNSCFLEAEPAIVSHGFSILQLEFLKDTARPLPFPPPSNPLCSSWHTNEQAAAFP